MKKWHFWILCLRRFCCASNMYNKIFLSFCKQNHTKRYRLRLR